MPFNKDPHSGGPRILFIGWPNSSHTHAWMDLLADAPCNVRLFGLPTLPPDTWKVRTYLTAHHGAPDPEIHRLVHGPLRRLRRGLAPYLPSLARRDCDEAALAEVITSWRPHVIHTLGFDPASYLYMRVRNSCGLGHIGKWVAQARGGPDLYLYRHDQHLLESMRAVMDQCDYFIADNQWNYDFARSLGLDDAKHTPFGIVSGTGGIDVDGLAARWDTPPSHRERVIYMPKAYENQAVKGLSALEGLRLAWPRITPCRVVMAWVVQPEMARWIRACLGEDILASCDINPLLPREDSIRHMLSARVVYAPSVLDGIPNSMLEAMCCGALPVVSPLESLEGVVEDEKNVLFARNLYPEELAQALVRAMNDDALADAAAVRNVARARELCERRPNTAVARSFYREIAGFPGGAA